MASARPYLVRKLRKAAKSHPCGDCPVEIPKGMDYVEDVAMNPRRGYGRTLAFRLGLTRWNLPCAPTREESLARQTQDR